MECGESKVYATARFELADGVELDRVAELSVGVKVVAIAES
jgi:hypothetical protein